MELLREYIACYLRELRARNEADWAEREALARIRWAKALESIPPR